MQWDVDSTLVFKYINLKVAFTLLPCMKSFNDVLNDLIIKESSLHEFDKIEEILSSLTSLILFVYHSQHQIQAFRICQF